MPSPRTPPAAHATRCKVVVRKPGDFWGFFPAAQLRCAARGCGRRARKRHGGASTFQHTPRERGGPGSRPPPPARQGSPRGGPSPRPGPRSHSGRGSKTLPSFPPFSLSLSSPPLVGQVVYDARENASLSRTHRGRHQERRKEGKGRDGIRAETAPGPGHPSNNNVIVVKGRGSPAAVQKQEAAAGLHRRRGREPRSQVFFDGLSPACLHGKARSSRSTEDLLKELFPLLRSYIGLLWPSGQPD